MVLNFDLLILFKEIFFAGNFLNLILLLFFLDLDLFLFLLVLLCFVRSIPCNVLERTLFDKFSFIQHVNSVTIHNRVDSVGYCY
jgi:hypothetical protein